MTLKIFSGRFDTVQNLLSAFIDKENVRQCHGTGSTRLSIQSLNTLGSFASELCCEQTDKQTNKQTDGQTDRLENPIHADLRNFLYVFQVRTAVSKTLVRLFENDVLGELLEDAPAQKDAYNRSEFGKRSFSISHLTLGIIYLLKLDFPLLITLLKS